MTAVGPGPSPPAAPPSDLPPAAYAGMAAVLRAGLYVALALLVGATVALVAREPTSAAANWISNNPLPRYLGLRSLADGLAAGRAEAYLTLGVFALIATPVVRVIAGAITFVRHGERRMGAITVTVLALLLVGLLVVGPLVR